MPIHPRLRALFRRAEVARELDEEMRYHLERDTDRNIANGMTATEARTAASRAFGNSTLHGEDARGEWQWVWLEVLGQDLRYGLRSLRRAPTFTLVAVLSLALGIGANTAIFGLIYHVLFQPLPVPHPEQLAVVTRIGPDGTDRSFNDREARMLGAAMDFTGHTVEWDVDNQPVSVDATQVFTNLLLIDPAYYATLKLSPYRGRLIEAAEVRQASPVAVVSAAFARQLFGSEDSAVGRTLAVHGQQFTVVGVTRLDYRGLQYPGYFQLAIPISLASSVGLSDPASGRGTWMQLIGRFSGADGRARAEAALNATFQRCCAGPAVEHLALEDMARGIGGGKDDMRSDLSPILYALMGCVFVVLLIACANVGNLLLLRSAAREREIAVRLSLGSSRSRIVRQLLTESALLAIAGGVLGLVLAGWTTGLLVHSLPDIGSQYVDIAQFHPTPRILGFAALVAAGSLLVCGVAPALAATRTDLVGPMKSGAPASTGRTTGLVTRSLVMLQVALALVLVSTASLLVATLRNLAARDVGVRTSAMIGMGVETRGTGYESGGIIPLWPGILRTVRGTSGVASAGMATIVPLFGGRNTMVQLNQPDGVPDGHDMVFTGASPGYFEAAGIELVAGRLFSDVDRAGAEPAAILGETVARRLGGPAIIGGIVHLAGGPADARRVVGIVRDVRLGGPREEPSSVLYAPLGQIGQWPYVELLLRPAAGSPKLIEDVTAAIQRSAPGIRIRNVATVEEKRAAWLVRELIAATLVGVFGVLALGLAAIGLYGVIAYHVARRTSELGVRMALGARQADIISLVARRSFTLVGLGILLGAPLVYAAGRAVQSLLYGVGAHDGGALGASLAILMGVALAATLIPALRAARIDPLAALRQD